MGRVKLTATSTIISPVQGTSGQVNQAPPTSVTKNVPNMNAVLMMRAPTQ